MMCFVMFVMCFMMFFMIYDVFYEYDVFYDMYDDFQVIDFGYSEVVSQERPVQWKLAGTPDFLAVEIAQRHFGHDGSM